MMFGGGLSDEEGKVYNTGMGRWAILFLPLAGCATVPTGSSAKLEVSPALVTTAGGTWVTVKNIPFGLINPSVEIGLQGVKSRYMLGIAGLGRPGNRNLASFRRRNHERQTRAPV